MTVRYPSADGTVYARGYLQKVSPELSRHPEERRRLLGTLAENIRRAVHDIMIFSVPDHWMLRVRGSSHVLDQLEIFASKTSGIEFARDNPPTDNLHEGSPESGGPTEHTPPQTH